MGERLPVTPALVRWARERAGFSFEEATRRFPKIQEWENGVVAPTYAQLEALADTFKVPVAVFFFPEPPKVPRIEETFRTLPEVAFDLLPPRIKLLLRKAKALQLALSELNDGTNPADRLITRDLRFHPTVEVEVMATQVRIYLGVSVEEQISWTTTEAALEAWRQRFADVGVYVFKDQFRMAGFSGFCLTDEEFPIIYLNNTSAKARQIFTLFHELAHLLFHTSGIDVEQDDYIERLVGDSRRIEVLCNRFAGEFLVPREALAEALRGIRIAPTSVADLSRRFKVSQLVIWRRLRDTNRISHAMYEDAHQRALAEERQPRDRGGDYYNNQLAYLGRPYVGLALSRYYQNKITEEQLADYLNITPKNIAPLEERFLRGAA